MTTQTDTQWTADSASRQAVKLAWGDLMGIDDEEYPGYPFAAVEFRKTLPESIQGEVERALAHVYHHEETPPWLTDDASR